MIVDKCPNNPRIYKLVQSFGFIVLFLAFAILGPFNTMGIDSSSLFNNMPMVVVAMTLKGLGSSGNNAAYPDMVVGIPEDDEMLQAAISGIWNAAYAVGWAAGPLLGGGLEQALHFDGFASTTALISLTYGVVLLVAAVLNIKPPEFELSEENENMKSLTLDASASSCQSNASDHSGQLDLKRAMYSRNVKNIVIPEALEDETWGEQPV
jgi:MFS family permease